MNHMQEKFQVVAKKPKDDDHQWADFRAQRTVAPITHGNELPTGSYIGDEQGNKQSFVALNLAGSTDVNNHVRPEALAKGYTKIGMSPVEDMYTDEHRDDFYDDVGGFVERANYLDRL